MFNLSEGGRKLSPAATEICHQPHEVEEFDCEVTFKDGFKIRQTVTFVVAIFDYIEAWNWTDKSKYTTNDIENIAILPIGPQKGFVQPSISTKGKY